MNAFIEARNAGLSPFPVRKGTKVPAVSWKQFQSEICSELQAVEWGNGGGYSIGLATGEVSGRLMAVDIEVSFMPRIAVLSQRMVAAGVGAVFDSWMSGYSESTPRGGLHVLVRLEGSGPCPRNEVFARDDDHKVLIETRGEGGYVLVAPSPGYRVTGGGFDQIVYCTLEEWAQIEAVLVSFDATPAPPALTVPTRSTVRFEGILGDTGPQWIDEVKTDLPSMEVVLDAHGWVSSGRRDDFGVHWVRPGKDRREGHSASISDADRLWVYSSNAQLPVGVSLDVVDVLWCYEAGRSDRPPTLEERTEWLQVRRPTSAERSDVDAASSHVEVADLNLSTEFWESRPYLAHIRQAALSLRLSPDAVWAGVKCFYAATIPWNHRLPGDGTVDYIAIVVGLSGAGKSRAKHAAYLLLESCHGMDGTYFPVPAGSGEGMTDFYLDRTDNERRYKARGLGFYADEGRFLLDISSRPGNTTMQAIKQMWSGELTGSVAATAERHRWLNPRDVRGTLLISTTPDVAAEFMTRDLTDEGLPQRIAWAWAHYPHPDTKPDWPGPLNLQVFDYNQTGDNTYTIDIDPTLLEAIDRRLLAAARGEQTDGLEGHATYAILKTAAIHAHLDHRMNITPQDWGLAHQDWEITRTVRQHVANAYQHTLTHRIAAAGQAQAYKEIAKNDVHLEKAVQSLLRKLKNSKEPLTKNQIRTHLATWRKRHQIPSQEVIDLATSRGLVTLTDEGYKAT